MTSIISWNIRGLIRNKNEKRPGYKIKKKKWAKSRNVSFEKGRVRLRLQYYTKIILSWKLKIPIKNDINIIDPPGHVDASIGKAVFSPSTNRWYLFRNSLCSSTSAKSSAIVISNTKSAPNLLNKPKKR